MPPLRRDNRVHHGGGTQSVGELVGRFAQGGYEALGAPIAFVSARSLDLVAAAAWLAATGTDGLVIPPSGYTDGLGGRLRRTGFAVVVDGAGQPAGDRGPRAGVRGQVRLVTSGTTGEPKLVTHRWDSLYTASRVHIPPLNWLLTYQDGTYAWYQVVTLALFHAGQSLTVADGRDPAGLIRAALAGGATALSATPTFWRLAMLTVPAEELARLRLRQITLGGERVDQPILDGLRELYPDASLTHIYASAEAGVAVVVNDRKEGFPTTFLAEDAEGGDASGVRIRDGSLWVRTRHAAGGRSGWMDTGDAAEIRGERVVILGRRDRAVVNVGGQKVAVSDVERRLLDHPGVLWCRAYRRRAPFVGEIVAADIVPRPDAPMPTEGDLTRWAADALPAHAVPRLWDYLQTVPATVGHKTEVR